VTKADIIAKIKKDTGIEKEDALATVEAFLSIVKNSMKDGHAIYIRGFGTFYNKKKAKKIGRNISKNTAIVIDEHFVPSFKPSKFFVEEIKASEKVKLANKKVKFDE
jgi:DNA-binding protein HU-beta